MTKQQYSERVEKFHQRLQEESHEDYLAAHAEDVMECETPVDVYEDLPEAARHEYARVVAERNRLFWASFLNEEAGEVAKALNDGQPPEDFEEEVADVLIICFAIADVFGFDMLAAFDAKMSQNEQKPARQDGTGKLPPAAHDEWVSTDE